MRRLDPRPLLALGMLVSTPALAFDVMLLAGVETGTDAVAVADMLANTNQIENVRVENNTSFFLPPLAEMLEYDAVMVFSDGGTSSELENPEIFGTLLSNYIQLGGSVVISTASNYSYTDQWGWNSRLFAPAGSFITDGYTPWLVDGTDLGSTGGQNMAKVEADHPLLNRVDTFVSQSSGDRTTGFALTEGTATIATWSDGVPLIVVNEHESGAAIVGVNVSPMADGSSAPSWLHADGDGRRMFVNALMYDKHGTPPEGIEFTYPGLNGVVPTEELTLEVVPGYDPDGYDLRVRVILDTDPNLDSPNRVTKSVDVMPGESVLEIPIEEAGVELPVNSEIYYEIWSQDPMLLPTMVLKGAFTYRATNDVPTVPEIIAPLSSARGPELLQLIVGNATDPDGDAVTYEFRVTEDAEGASVVLNYADVPEGAGTEGNLTQTSQLIRLETGDYFWSARAVDEFGAASEWTESVAFRAGDQFDSYSGCSATGLAGLGAPALFLGLLGLRRRQD